MTAEMEETTVRPGEVSGVAQPSFNFLFSSGHLFIKFVFFELHHVEMAEGVVSYFVSTIFQQLQICPAHELFWLVEQQTIATEGVNFERIGFVHDVWADEETTSHFQLMHNLCCSQVVSKAIIESYRGCRCGYASVANLIDRFRIGYNLEAAEQPRQELTEMLFF